MLITIFLSLLSLLANIWVTLVYLKNPDLQKHPSTILALISVFEIAMSQHAIALALETNFSIQGLGPHYLIRTLSLFHLTNHEAKSISCAINQMLYAGSVSGVLSYNTFLCIDFLITLRNPLIPGKKRLVYYHFFSVFIVISQMIYNAYWNMGSTECSMSSSWYIAETWNKGALIYLFIVYIAIAMYTVIYSLFKLCIKGKYINQATKSYLTRHIYYITVMSVMWSWSASNFLYELYRKDSEAYRRNKTYLLHISTIVISISGFVLAIMRNWEKSFWNKSKELLKKTRDNRVSSSLLTDRFSTFIFEKDFREAEDTWNMPTSFIMQESMKSNTTLCILMGVHEALKKAKSESDDKEVKAHKVLFGNKDYKISIIHFYSFPYFIIEEHKPGVFAKLRKLAKINLAEALDSVHPENNKLTLLSQHQEQGGSGSLFIFTENKKYTIKIITVKERDFLLKKLLSKYHQHIENNPFSLLNRIFGVFTIKVPGLSPLEIILTPCLVNDSVSRFYDLKGSTYNRLCHKPDQQYFKGPFKDSDFINENCKFCLHPSIKTHLLKQIFKDSKFLMDQGIMDYSLIVSLQEHEDAGLVPSSDLRTWYQFGIIDYLGEFNFKRKAEYYVKLIRLGKRIKMCSVMNPRSYYERFLSFVKSEVLFS